MPLLVSGISDDDEFRGRPPPPNYSIYEPLYETACDGEIITRDPHLNSDGEAIVQFFVQHNTPPRLEVQFHGHHEETRWETRSTRDQDGNLVEERVPMNVIVDDFNFSIDASDFVAPECDGLCVSPDKKTGIRKSVRQLCDDFVHDKNKLKELELTKEHKITIKSTSKWSRYLEHKGIRLLLFLSCLWILVLPIQWFYRKRFGHNSLWSNWHMKITAQDWYNLQVQEVTHHVHHRCSRVGTVPFISG
ncbi:hypothetical protein BX666DRAFT_1857333 [Dichotomocladium elegans]|nr:hypothetical protein BX666DRAFT_1857333 [Dichotomocladium elegans]